MKRGIRRAYVLTQRQRLESGVFSIAAVAAQMGITVGYVRKICRKAGITWFREKRPKWRRAVPSRTEYLRAVGVRRDARLRPLVQQGLSLGQMASALGVTRQAVHALLRKNPGLREEWRTLRGLVR